MYKIRKSKITSLFNSINIGLGVTFSDMKDTIVKEVSLDKVLEKVNNQELSLGEVVEVSGFFSPYAPVIEPSTYSELIYHIHEKRIGNKIVGETKLEVKGFAPVVSKIVNEDKAIGFLYFCDDLKQSPFKYQSHNKRDLVVSLRNCYIPIILPKECVTSLTNKYVRLSCRINMFSHQKARELFRFDTSEFQKVISLFYDDFSMYVQSLYLDYVSCESCRSQECRDLKINYGVEIKVQSNHLSNRDVFSEVNGVCVRESLNNYNYRMRDNKRKINQSAICGGLTINWKNDKIGVYRELDLLNQNFYRKQLIELFHKVNSIIQNFEEEKFEIFITFISDDSHAHLVKATR